MADREDRRLARTRPAAVAPREPQMGLADLVKRVGDDFGELAKNHFELARIEMTGGLKRAAGDGAAMILGGFVGLVGLAMLCVAAVAGAAPIIPALWLRLLLGALLYMGLGALIVYLFVKRLREEKPLSLDKTRDEVEKTAHVLAEQIQT